MLTSLLTLYAVAKSWNLAFWRTPEEAHEMARTLSDLGRRSGSAVVVAHRDHVHTGAATVAVRDQAEARSILDENDETNQDLHQLTVQDALDTRPPRTMIGATGALVAASLTLTVVAGPLFDYTGRAADDLLDRDLYISSVLPEGSP